MSKFHLIISHDTKLISIDHEFRGHNCSSEIATKILDYLKTLMEKNINVVDVEYSLPVKVTNISVDHPFLEEYDSLVFYKRDNNEPHMTIINSMIKHQVEIPLLIELVKCL